jgi:hypothetical protein
MLTGIMSRIGCVTEATAINHMTMAGTMDGINRKKDVAAIRNFNFINTNRFH